LLESRVPISLWRLYVGRLKLLTNGLVPVKNALKTILLNTLSHTKFQSTLPSSPYLRSPFTKPPLRSSFLLNHHPNNSIWPISICVTFNSFTSMAWDDHHHFDIWWRWESWWKWTWYDHRGHGHWCKVIVHGVWKRIWLSSRGGELNFKRFLQFNSQKIVFAIRKSLVKLSDQEYKVQQKVNWLQVRMNWFIIDVE